MSAPALDCITSIVRAKLVNDDQLTNSDVAILCDVGSGSPSIGDSKKTEVAELISRGFIEHDSKDAGMRLKLTAKAQKVLAARGVGINEG